MERVKNAAECVLSGDALAQALKLPENTEIVGGQWNWAHNNFSFWVVGDSMPEVLPGGKVQTLCAIVKSTALGVVRYTWSWPGLKKRR